MKLMSPPGTETTERPRLPQFALSRLLWLIALFAIAFSAIRIGGLAVILVYALILLVLGFVLTWRWPRAAGWSFLSLALLYFSSFAVMSTLGEYQEAIGCGAMGPTGGPFSEASGSWSIWMPGRQYTRYHPVYGPIVMTTFGALDCLDQRWVHPPYTHIRFPKGFSPSPAPNNIPSPTPAQVAVLIVVLAWAGLGLFAAVRSRWLRPPTAS